MVVTHELILMLQDLRLSSPEIVMSLMLFVSNPLFYLVMPLAVATYVLWFKDKKKGEWIVMNIVTGMFIGHFLKDVIRNPRPWITDDRIVPEEKALKGASGYSTPSGHSTDSASAFLSLACVFGKRFLSLLFIAAMLLIMFARLFLGVHTLMDVLTGVFIAIFVMLLNWVLISVSYTSDGAYFRVSAVYFLLFMAILVPWILIANDIGPITSYGEIMLGTIIGRQIEHSYIGYEPRMMDCRGVIKGLLIGWFIAGMMVAVPYLALDPQLGLMLGGFFGAIGIFTAAPFVLKKITKPALNDQ